MYKIKGSWLKEVCKCAIIIILTNFWMPHSLSWVVVAFTTLVVGVGEIKLV